MNICKIENCNLPIVNKRGWCSKHYLQWYRKGDPLFRKERVYRNPTHTVWSGMKQRCNDKNYPAYKDYGGRGITYDPKWETYLGFLEDMGERPEGLTLDRIDVNGNYTRGNCRWATPRGQANNRRNNVIIEYKGLKKTVAQWEYYLNLPKDTLSQRLRKDWSIERAIETPLKIYKNTRL